MSSAINLLSPPWIALRSQLREIFAERAEHRVLEQELADYTSEKDLTDLVAILDRHSDAETGDIRRILGART
jgi:predicted lipid carrier protein YhbT